MKHYAGIDVSLNSSSVCVVDESGKIVREVKVASEPVALIRCIKSFGVMVERIGLEAGPLNVINQTGGRIELIIPQNAGHNGDDIQFRNDKDQL